MKIVFNVVNCGLGNNGGSHTIVQSANTLQHLGHDVTILDSGKNKYNWSKLNVKHLIGKIEDVKDSDVIIGTGVKTFESTSKSKIQKKFLSCRF